ncbi:tyrosine--tRNA ligase [Haloarcula amylovorans]|uniref:tyrosine--tRNA ligase n=1 Tax=Haloarcula amylovorans TaxID=2562280 RepID=UPI001075E591|nr:tyrosine--tRNA ligase [Halomicroarcula amylolytica]
MDRKHLVERDTEETITEDELTVLLESKDTIRAYIGFEPSGPVHLGTWLSIFKLLDVQKAGFTPVVLLADLHAYKNSKGELAWLEAMAEYWEAVFRALGLKDAEYILGSEFQTTSDYQDDLERLKSEVTVNRAVRALGDVADDSESATISQIEYPLMQALDIEYLDVDLALGGTDQRKIHMLARDELPRIGFSSPTALHFGLLPALTGTGEKMSTSKPETMFPLHAPEETVRSRIQGAFLDPELTIAENPILEIGDRFIFKRGETLHIQTEYVDRKYTDTEQIHAEMQNWASDSDDGETIHPQDVKTGIADWLVAELKPVREMVKDCPEILQPIEEM